MKKWFCSALIVIFILGSCSYGGDVTGGDTRAELVPGARQDSLATQMSDPAEGNIEESLPRPGTGDPSGSGVSSGPADSLVSSGTYGSQGAGESSFSQQMLEKAILQIVNGNTWPGRAEKAYADTLFSLGKTGGMRVFFSQPLDPSADIYFTSGRYEGSAFFSTLEYGGFFRGYFTTRKGELLFLEFRYRLDEKNGWERIGLGY